MNTSKITITFVIVKNRINKAGKCSLKCRITYQKSRHEFATGLFVVPDNWINSQQQVATSNKESTYINAEISLIKNN